MAMKATEYGEGFHDGSIAVRADLGGHGCGLAEGLVRSGHVEMIPVLDEDGPKVGFAENDHGVQTLSAHASKKSLAYRIHEWRSDWTSNDLGVRSLRNAVDEEPKLGVTVTDDEGRALAERRRVAKLLGGPWLHWSPGDREVQRLSGVHVNDEEREQGGGRRYRRPGRSHTPKPCDSSGKSVPVPIAGRGTRPGGADMSLHSPLGDVNAELQ